MSRRGTRAAREAAMTGFGWQKREAAEWALLAQRTAAIGPQAAGAAWLFSRFADQLTRELRPELRRVAGRGPEVRVAWVDEVSDPAVSAALDAAVDRG